MQRKKVLITGAYGLMGTALNMVSEDYPELDIIRVGREHADLTKKHEVDNLLRAGKPDAVIHAAAKVGGVLANMRHPAEFFHQNIIMNANVIEACWRHGVKDLFAFSSACAFPDGLPVLQEDLLHEGPPPASNSAYGHAKRMVDVQIQAYNKEYGKRYVSIIPVNIFGEGDNFNLNDAHVIPALIHKCFLAKKTDTDLVVWGDGSPQREFMYAPDASHIILKLLSMNTTLPDKIIVSNENEVSIREVVEDIVQQMNLSPQRVIWDTSMPSGQFRRPSDSTRLKSLLPDHEFTDLKDAIRNTVRWFKENHPNVRQ